jgi:hypothetical protein
MQFKGWCLVTDGLSSSSRLPIPPRVIRARGTGIVASSSGPFPRGVRTSANYVQLYTHGVFRISDPKLQFQCTADSSCMQMQTL